MAPGDSANLVDGLNNSRFIVGVHDDNENGIRRDRRFKLFRADRPIGLNWQISYPRSFFFKMFAGVKDRLMFCRCGNDMISLAGIGFAYSFDRKIIPLSSPRSENNFFRICANESSDLFTRQFDSFLGLPAEKVRPACCIPILNEKKGTMASSTRSSQHVVALLSR